MRELLKVWLVSAVGLAVVFAAVILRGDATTAVPPPDAVGEQFAKQIATRRYERALQYVDEQSGITFITVRLGGDTFHRRAGAINQVKGEPGTMSGDRATASAVLFTDDAGRVRFSYRFARKRGVWKIVEWEIR